MLHKGVADQLTSLQASIESIAIGVTDVRVDVQGVREETRLLKEHQKTQNGDFVTLRLDQAEQKGAAAEKEKWELREAANMKWIVVTGVAATGVLSGIVFGVVTLVVALVKA